MVVDTSVLIAILRKEEGFESFSLAIENAPFCLLSAVSYVEASIVLAGSEGETLLIDLDSLLEDAEIILEPVLPQDAMIARKAFLKYGKGRHNARLNFGDCFSYALAKRMGVPLLFKGNDFSQTDVLQN